MIKTEQEQRRAIRQILFDANDICQATPCENEYCIYHGDYRCYDNVIVDKLIRAGYGDVSEYKAEIEQLKTDFITLECNYDKIYDEHKGLKIENENLKTLNNKLRECIDYLKAEIKHTKIDVLNTARERCDLVAEELEDEIDHYGSSAAYSCAYEIKKLIKEIEEQ